MKKILSIIALITVMIFIGCVPPSVDKVTNLKIEAANDGAAVKLTWDAIENADEYNVYFNGTLLATVENTEYTHSFDNDADAKTGEYRVSAVIGGTEGEQSDAVDDIPVITDNVQLYEIGGTGSSGFGWNVNTGAAASFSMADASNASSIDLYFTNWTTGYAGTYDIASPHLVDQDEGASWLHGTTGWRTTGIAEITELFDDATILPSTGYNNYVENVTQGNSYGVYTQDGYYGLIEVKSISEANGTIDTRSAFQKVKGLRILAH